MYLGLMGFSDNQMREVINNNEVVKASCLKIKEACQSLKDGTGCPDEDIDQLLTFLVGKWH